MALLLVEKKSPLHKNITLLETPKDMHGLLMVYADMSQRLVFGRMGSREGKSVVFTTTLFAWSGFNPHPGRVAAFLNTVL